jgi:hypothetical protein
MTEHNALEIIEDIGRNGPATLRALAWLNVAKAVGVNTTQGQGYLLRAASEAGGNFFVRSELRKAQGRVSGSK